MGSIVSAKKTSQVVCFEFDPFREPGIVNDVIKEYEAKGWELAQLLWAGDGLIGLFQKEIDH